MRPSPRPLPSRLSRGGGGSRLSPLARLALTPTLSRKRERGKECADRLAARRDSYELMRPMRVAHVGIATTLAVAFLVAIGCDGSIGGHGASGTGGGGAKPTDPGIIDQGGTTGAGNTTGTRDGRHHRDGHPLHGGQPAGDDPPLPADPRPVRQLGARADRPRHPPVGRLPRRSEPGRVRSRHGSAGRRRARQELPRGRRDASRRRWSPTPTAFSKVVGCDAAGGDSCAQVVHRCTSGASAYRRPLTDAEKTPLLHAVRQRRRRWSTARRDNFHKGVQLVARGDAAVPEVPLPGRAVDARRRRPDRARRLRAGEPPVVTSWSTARPTTRCWTPPRRGQLANADARRARRRAGWSRPTRRRRRCATSTTSGW